MEIIKNWFIGNGTTLNIIYGAVLLFIILSFFMSAKHSDDSHKDNDLNFVDSAIGFFLFGSIFAIPSVLLYAFDGDGETKNLIHLSPMPFSELLWFHKIILIAFGILFVVFFLTVFCLGRNFTGFWNVMAIDSVIVLVCVIFMLLERGVNALIPGSVILSLALMLIHTIVQFYSYIALIVMPALVVLSPFLNLIPGVRHATVYDVNEDRAYNDLLDEKERRFNSLTGTGYFTNDEAFMRGKIDANEWATNSILRDNKMDKLRKK